jgi:hypothetical protein
LTEAEAGGEEDKKTRGRRYGEEDERIEEGEPADHAPCFPFAALALCCTIAT